MSIKFEVNKNFVDELLILNKYKIDPDLATGPFITKFTDIIIGLIIYFSIGQTLLS